MKILIVSATFIEVAPLFNFLKLGYKDNKKFYCTDFFGNHICILITGVGMVNMTYFFSNIDLSQYDLIINAGFAGSFNEKLEIGQIVNVHKDRFADMGIATKEGFLTIFDMNLANGDEYPFENQAIINHGNKYKNFFADIKLVDAITVNTVSNTPHIIKLFKSKYNAEIETMEGAAFMFVAKMKNVNFYQIRSISNYVQPTEQAQWNKYKAQIQLYEYLKMKLIELIVKIAN